jgi:hypothetical protein
MASPAYELVPSWDSQIPTAEAVETVQYTPPPINIKPAPTPSPKKSNFLTKQVPIWIVGASSLGCLTLGCIAGREHLKYQVRSKMEQAFSQIGDTIGIPKPKAEKQSATTSNKLAPSVAVTPPKQYALGEVFSERRFSIAVIDARIGKARLAERIGDTKYNSGENYLLLTLQLTNNDPRKKLSFSEDGGFRRSNFIVRDDVDNVVRGVDFGFSTVIEGAFQEKDINPGETVRHLCVFSEPLPKTEHLVLNVDFKCFYEEGEVEFKLPINVIKRER